jgi:hypothetical protein
MPARVINMFRLWQIIPYDIDEVSHTNLSLSTRIHHMDFLVPPDVTAELTQILSNLVLGDNEIRSK